MSKKKSVAARKIALDYSRKLPAYACSPHGALAISEEDIKRAFRECYEALRWQSERIDELELHTITTGGRRGWINAARKALENR